MSYLDYFIKMHQTILRGLYYYQLLFTDEKTKA